LKTLVLIFAYPEGGIGTHIIDIYNSKISKEYSIILVSNFSKKDKKFEKFLKENSDIKLINLNIPKKPSFIDIKNMIKLYNIFKSQKNIIFHGHGAKGGFYSRIVGKLLNKKVIYTPHGGSLHLNYGKLKNFVFKFIEKVLYNLTDKLIFESNYSFKQYEKNVVRDSKNKCIINYNGVKILNCKNSKIKQNKNLIIDSYGSLRKLKGHDILIRGIYKILKKNNNLNLEVRIFGDGDEKENLINLINYYNLSKVVKLKGYVDDIKKYLEECDLVIHPSRVESLPYAILEAMNLCKPVIASNVGGVSEIIKHKYNGLLFEKENEEELINSIELLIKNTKLKKIIIKNAKKVIIDKFNKNKMIENLLNVYKELNDKKTF